jgi:hypothetical protein
MSKRHEVDQAVFALLKAGLPNYDVAGLENGDERARRVNPIGSVVMRDGEPGEPEIDLSPVTYHYRHSIPVEIAASAPTEQDLRIVLDRMGREIGALIAADRFLGDLVGYIEVTALSMADLVGIAGPGAQTIKGATFEIIASYSTDTPL